MGMQRVTLLVLFLLLTGCAELKALIPGAEPIPHPTPITQDFPNPARALLVSTDPARALLVSTPLTLPTSANFTWQWAPVPGTSDIAGFKLSLGTAPGTYSRTIDIPDKDLRAFVATGLDLFKVNYAVLQSYTSFGIVSFPTTELVFGGQPSSPLFLTATPVTP